MPSIQSGYRRVVEALEPFLHDLPAKIVAIDGRDGVGKTTLGRYLAWHFNVSLIETDLFLPEGARGVIKRDAAEVSRIIQFRLDKPRPVIVEGVALLQLFHEMKRQPDFLVYTQAAEHSTDPTMARLLNEYETKFMPKQAANLMVDLES